jgi:hypothetical protein
MPQATRADRPAFCRASQSQPCQLADELNEIVDVLEKSSSCGGNAR